MEDLLKKTIEITDLEFRDELIREGALNAVLEEIKETGVVLPGVVLCCALIEGMKAQFVQRRALLAYRLASKNGVPIHLCGQIETVFDHGKIFMHCYVEGGEK